MRNLDTLEAPRMRDVPIDVPQPVRMEVGDADSIPRVNAISLRDLLARHYRPREWLLEPVIPSQGLAMIYAPRGIGKTHVALGIAHAVASGGRFLGWDAPKPRGVLFIDGEMPAVTLQERLAQIVAASNKEITAPFRIVTPDEQDMGMPDLGTIEGQAAIDALVDDETALIIVDNISTLVRSGKENESEGWLSVQTWALQHRAAGRSVLFIHHAGKNGAQRGSSRREDVLDTVIALRYPADYTPEMGAAFEVHFEKSRRALGEAVRPFEARLGEPDPTGNPWSVRSLEDSTYDRVVALAKENLSQKEIADELHVSRATVSRHLKRARTEGRLKGGQ